MSSNIDKYQKITYYKLPENYHYFEDTDVTKFDSLTGDEVDANFFVLEGRDIDTIEVSEDRKRLVIRLINGSTVESENIFNDYIESLSFDYDQEDGVLTVCINDCDHEPIKVEGFLTLDDVAKMLQDFYIYTDNTITGIGTITSPMSIAYSQRTGNVKMITGIVNELPESGAAIGDRYITYEDIDYYGRYYNFDGLVDVIQTLEKEKNGWKVATKNDWDNILNYLERDIHKTHNQNTPSRWLGQRANAKLKQQTQFGLVYAGYVFNGDERVVSFKDKKASFWVASNINGDDLNNNDTEAWVKQFSYTRGQIYQTLVDNSIYSSIRLVKDCDENEKVNAATILGEVYPVTILNTDKDKFKMWTTINLNYQTKNINNSFKEENTIIKKPFINEWDGSKWIKIGIDNYTTFVLKNENRLYIVIDNNILPLKYDKSPLLKIKDSIDYVYENYTYNGIFEINENKLTYTINSDNLSNNEHLTDDFNHFLGALFYTNYIPIIQFNYQYYDWDDNGNNEGSNYKLAGGPIEQVNSLVTAIVTVYQEDPHQTLKVKFDNSVVDIVINVINE